MEVRVVRVVRLLVKPIFSDSGNRHQCHKCIINMISQAFITLDHQHYSRDLGTFAVAGRTPDISLIMG